MDGALSAFKPYHRIQAARELLSTEASANTPLPVVPAESRNPEEVGSGGHGYSLMQKTPSPSGRGLG